MGGGISGGDTRGGKKPKPRIVIYSCLSFIIYVYSHLYKSSALGGGGRARKKLGLNKGGGALFLKTGLPGAEPPRDLAIYMIYFNERPPSPGGVSPPKGGMIGGDYMGDYIISPGRGGVE